MTIELKYQTMQRLAAIVLGLCLIAVAMVWSQQVIAPAQAADVRYPPPLLGAGKHKKLVRLGLNKSMVVRLPRAARDVLVSNPKKVDAVIRAARTSYLIGLEVGQTNVFYFDAAGRQIMNLEILVERDLDVLRAMYRRLLPDSTIKVEAINDNIVLTGTVANAAQSKRAADIAQRLAGKAEKVLNMMAIAGKEQVLLRVSVVEMQRTVLKQLGVDLTSMLNISKAVLDLKTVNPFTLFGAPLSGTRLITGYSGNNVDVSTTIRAMERNGLLRTLAEPTLTAISGEAAKFLAGGEFPVPASRDRDGNVTVEFKPFGVGLAFTPVVMTEGRISLKISTEVSELTTDGAFTLNDNTSSALTIPALKVRRAETTVEMPSGGSLVMAGLIQENTKQSLNGVPGIKDVPILGALFRSRDFQTSETELVVIVTPYVVNAVARKKLLRPDHRFSPATDTQTILLGRLNKVYGAQGRGRLNGQYHGNFGFVE
jgi:pilus assembly protein CpaC